VLNSHDFLVSKQLLGIVVNELPVDEHIDSMAANLLDLKNCIKQASRKFSLPFASSFRVRPPQFQPPLQLNRLGHGFQRL
jgi:hypothetical protein